MAGIDDFAIEGKHFIISCIRSYKILTRFVFSNVNHAHFVVFNSNVFMPIVRVRRKIEFKCILDCGLLISADDKLDSSQTKK